MCDVNVNQIIDSNFLLRQNTKYKAIQEKIFTVQAMTAYKGSRGVTPIILNLGNKEG
jgi:hypothetical protein